MTNHCDIHTCFIRLGVDSDGAMENPPAQRHVVAFSVDSVSCGRGGEGGCPDIGDFCADISLSFIPPSYL